MSSAATKTRPLNAEDTEIASPSGGPPQSWGTLHDVDRVAAWFRELLVEEGVTPAPGSAFAASLDALDYLARRGRREIPQLRQSDVPRRLREGLGAYFVLRALQRVIEVLRPNLSGYWRTFRGPNLNLISSASRTRERDTLWEILVAALCTSFATRVELAEPDVVCDFRETTWGLPCKLLHSPDIGTQIDRLVEGAKQVEKSRVHAGIIMLNVTNLLDHDQFFQWREREQGFVTFFDQEFASKVLRQSLAEIAQRFDRPDVIRRLTQDRDGKPRVRTRSVLFFAQTLISLNGQPALHSLSHQFDFRDSALGESEFLDSFNHAAQMIMIDR